MRVEIVAVGSELLLGQIADTNSRWLGEQLAALGIPCHYHQHVGDNTARIVLATRTALARSDAVVLCGGLGPTQDDVTREAIAEVLGVGLERDEALVARIRAMFESRGRTMPESNARQADVPSGATVIEQRRGTAPGLVCDVGRTKVLYALPGVPHELEEMFTRAVAPDLIARSDEQPGVIASRVLRTWGPSESALAEALDVRLRAVEGSPLTIAFLASGAEGLKVRLTVRARNAEDAAAHLAEEEHRVRGQLTESFGDVVFGVDDETMERAVASRLLARGLTLGVAESLTGGSVSSRLVGVEGASDWFRGGVVSYASDVKFSVLGVREGPVVTSAAAEQMAQGVVGVVGSDVGLSLTGVAGPTDEEGQPVGTVFVGVALPDRPVSATQLRLPGDRNRVREYATISALDVLRRALDALASPERA